MFKKLIQSNPLLHYLRDTNNNVYKHTEPALLITTTEIITNDDSDAITKNILEEVDEPPTDISDVPEEKQDTGKIDIDNYLFQSEFDDDEEPAEVIVEEDEGKVTLQKQEKTKIVSTSTTPIVQPYRSKIYKFKPSHIIPYRLKFRTDYVTTQLDNSLLFGGLDSYAGHS